MNNPEEAPFIDLSIETLRVNAEAQLALLSAQSTDVETYTGNVNALIRQYNLRKSYFGYAAHWYGEQQWWIKLIFSMVLAAVGTLFQIPLVITALLSLALSFLFINHHHISSEKDRLIASDLEDQRASLAGSVTLLNETRAQLGQITIHLCTLHMQMAAAHTQAEQQLETLGTNLEESKALIQQQEIALAQSLADQKNLQEKLALAGEQINQYEITMQQQTRQLQDTDAKLEKTNQDLGQHSEALAAKQFEFSSQVQQLSELAKVLNTDPESPEANSIQDHVVERAQKIADELLPAADAAVDETEKTIKHVEAHTPPRTPGSDKRQSAAAALPSGNPCGFPKF
ncbi:MAG: hypothetical protein NXI01_00910 [Gammaproteobacteria bacterium]|nr:hypothetical protein [Gammaproteobacteria bacterium]